MSEEQLKAFLEKVKGDSTLQEKLKAASNPDAVVEIAKDAGFVISPGELQKSQAELSEAELEVIAGGGFWRESIQPHCQNVDPNLTMHPKGVACTS